MVGGEKVPDVVVEEFGVHWVGGGAGGVSPELGDGHEGNAGDESGFVAGVG